MSRVWDESLNPYNVLELAAGPKSTETEIKKAYKKLAKLKHPDKNPDAKVEDFHLIHSAYEILCDAAARAAYDAVLQARQLNEERWQKQSEKRRRMREDLEEKEKAAARERRAETAAQAALHTELERLRKKLESEHTAKTLSTKQQSPSQQQGLNKMVKIKWTDRKCQWTEEKLRNLLTEWVRVSTVVLRCRKRYCYSAVVELAAPSEVQLLMSLHKDLLEGTSSRTSTSSELLLNFTLSPLQSVTAESVPPVPFSPSSLSEDEVLAKMRRVSQSR